MSIRAVGRRVPTLFGPALMVVGCGLEFGAVVALALGLGFGLWMALTVKTVRRRHGQSPAPRPEVAPNEAERLYRLSLWLVVAEVALIPASCIALLLHFGLTPGSLLIAAGVAVTLVLGVQASRHVRGLLRVDVRGTTP
jgi:hypothetical protein